MAELDGAVSREPMPIGLSSIDRFADYLGKVLRAGIVIDEVSPDARLVEDLGIDSFGAVLVADAVFSIAGIEVELERLAPTGVTVRDLYLECMEQLSRPKEPSR